jgi:hypothetical protein
MATSINSCWSQSNSCLICFVTSEFTPRPDYTKLMCGNTHKNFIFLAAGACSTLSRVRMVLSVGTFYCTTSVSGLSRTSAEGRFALKFLEGLPTDRPYLALLS